MAWNRSDRRSDARPNSRQPRRRLPSGLEATHNVWRERLSELFDKIGPAIIMSHSMGGPSGWIIGDARPNLVKGIIGVEPAGPPFGNLKWGLTASRVSYDPPASDPSN